jgi:hypothetical protein
MFFKSLFLMLSYYAIAQDPSLNWTQYSLTSRGMESRSSSNLFLTDSLFILSSEYTAWPDGGTSLKTSGTFERRGRSYYLSSYSLASYRQEASEIKMIEILDIDSISVEGVEVHLFRGGNAEIVFSDEKGMIPLESNVDSLEVWQHVLPDQLSKITHRNSNNTEEQRIEIWTNEYLAQREGITFVPDQSQGDRLVVYLKPWTSEQLILQNELWTRSGRYMYKGVEKPPKERRHKRVN